jgi:hypothetical protein
VDSWAKQFVGRRAARTRHDHSVRAAGAAVLAFSALAFSVPRRGRLFSILLAYCFVLPGSVENALALSPRSTIDIPGYVFEHEEQGVRAWRIDPPYAYTASFAYLVSEPDQSGNQTRSLILVDNLEHPKAAWFLAGQNLLRVPAIKGKPLASRIDMQLSTSMKVLDSSGVVTINVLARDKRTEQIKFHFTPALNGFYEKFEQAPCLTLPDIMSLSRGAQTLEFSVLLKNQKRSDGFDPKCGKYTDDLVPPTFSYIQAGGLGFAFTDNRLVISHLNYVVWIP